MPHSQPQPKPMQTVKGIPVSPGIVIARAFVLGEAETHVPHREIEEREIETELARLDGALRDASADLVLLRDRTEQQLGREAHPARAPATAPNAAAGQRRAKNETDEGGVSRMFVVSSHSCQDLGS